MGAWPSHDAVTSPHARAHVPKGQGRARLPGLLLAARAWAGAMALATAWLSAAEGTLPAIEQAKLWGLRAALRKLDEDDKQVTWMSQQVRLAGGGHPTKQAVTKFFQRVDADPDWHPGKRGAVGRPARMTPARRRRIAASAMAMKRRGEEPSYDAVVAQCPETTRNPDTGLRFSRTRINDVLTTECFDHQATKPWRFVFPRKKRPLAAAQMTERAGWARRLLREGNTPAWYAHNIIWADISSKVIPGTPQKAYQQGLAGAGKRRRLMSADAAGESRHLAGTSPAERQASTGDTRVYFFLIVTRGKVGAHVFTDVEKFPGETQAGAALCVEQLPGLLRRMLGRDTPKPRTLFTDRGPGFYNLRYGTVTGDYEGACRHRGFQLWAGTNSKTGPRAQPGDLADVFPHETVTGWVRARLVKSAAELAAAWQETPALALNISPPPPWWNRKVNISPPPVETVRPRGCDPLSPTHMVVS